MLLNALKAKPLGLLCHKLALWQQGHRGKSRGDAAGQPHTADIRSRTIIAPAVEGLAVRSLISIQAIPMPNTNSIMVGLV